MLLDTFAWIEYFDGTEKGNKVREIIKKNECFTSAISIAELSTWIERKDASRKETLSIVRAFSTIISLDEHTLEFAGIIRADKAKTVKGTGLVDSIIIATGRQYNLPILTGGPHFEGENAVML